MNKYTMLKVPFCGALIRDDNGSRFWDERVEIYPESIRSPEGEPTIIPTIILEPGLGAWLVPSDELGVASAKMASISVSRQPCQLWYFGTYMILLDSDLVVVEIHKLEFRSGKEPMREVLVKITVETYAEGAWDIECGQYVLAAYERRREELAEEFERNSDD